ncbi:unnamed protein product [Rhizoctonia solani]|uniref:Uncharacterized protein n=1 Tax=Rhizoctonia solani TaxID=456999 RepID=A0A8H3E2X9_9AGAM|nr:unnamed protein product [Rhizoctonia solani]
MITMQVSHSGGTVLIPPRLPAYLSDTHILKQIIGKPTDEDVKAIHAVVRAQSTISHPSIWRSAGYDVIQGDYETAIHDFDRPLTTIYRGSYSKTLLPGEKNVYTPPTLPSHVPGTLHQVAGAPSDEEIKLVQETLRGLENLSNSPHLFDPDLSMRLSQHMFNLQFARYMRDSSEGNFVSETQLEALNPVAPREEPKPGCPGLRGEERNVPQAPSELTPLRETMKEIHEVMRDIQETMRSTKDTATESKDVLKTMNRALTLIRDHQCSVAAMDKYYHIYKNPVNREGVVASEYGLPQLRYGYYQDGLKYAIPMCDDLMVKYLKFFGVGANLIEGGEKPKLIKGKNKEAENLILKEIGYGPYWY